MPMMRADASTLLLIDFQAKLMPAMDHAAATVANAQRLSDAASARLAFRSFSPNRIRRASARP